MKYGGYPSERIWVRLITSGLKGFGPRNLPDRGDDYVLLLRCL